MKQELLVIVLFAVISANGNKWGLPEDDRVPYLTAANFEEFLAEHPVMFVEFYAPWCGHCKKMAPEFQRLVQRMNDDINSIPVVKVDVTQESALGDKYAIQGFPTLKLFKNGEVIDYKGPRTETHMYNFIIRESGDVLKKLGSKSEIEQFLKTPLGVLYVLPEEDEKALDNFRELANSIKDALFAYTHNQEDTKSIGLKDTYNLLIVRDFDDGNKSMGGSKGFSIKDMQSFIEEHRYPALLEFDEKVAQRVLGERRPAIILFTDDYDIPEVKDFKEVAKEFKGLIYFGLSKIQSGFGERLSAIADVGRGPAVRIISANPQGVEKYIVNDTTKHGIAQGIEDFRAGRLPPFYKSELQPAPQTGAVKNLIGNNFYGEVINNDKFVLVEGYAPWCGHCKNLEPIYEELASKLSHNKDIVIAKMDATKNEFPGFNVRGYPTIMLYKPGSKNAPIYYNGERTVELLTQFLEEHVGRKLNGKAEEASSEL